MNPYDFAHLPRPMQVAVLKQMTPRQRVKLANDFKLVINQSLNGLGDLGSWFSDIFHEVIEPVLPIAGAALDVISPGVGTGLRLGASALFPTQRGASPPPVTNTAPAAGSSSSSSSSSMLPIALGVGALLLFAGGKRR